MAIWTTKAGQLALSLLVLGTAASLQALVIPFDKITQPQGTLVRTWDNASPIPLVCKHPI